MDKSKPLDGCIFVLDLPNSTKISTKVDYQNFIKSNGGQVDFVVTSKTTHFITHDINSFKAKSATKFSPAILALEYLLDSVRDNEVKYIYNYLIIDGVQPNKSQLNSFHPSIITAKFSFILNQISDLNNQLIKEKSITPIQSNISTTPNIKSSPIKNSTQPTTTTTINTTNNNNINNNINNNQLSILNQRKLELELKNKEKERSILEKQNEKLKLIEKKKKEKEEKLLLALQEKEKKHQAESERRKSVLTNLGISTTTRSTSTYSFSDFKSFSSFTTSTNQNKSRKSKSPKIPPPQLPLGKSKKQLKKEKAEEDLRLKKLAKEERTRIFHETKETKDMEDKIKKDKEKEEAYQLYLIREEKRKKKKQLEMEANGEIEPTEASDSTNTLPKPVFVRKPDPEFVSKDLRKIFVGGIDFKDLSTKYSRKPKQLSKLKEKKKSLLLHQFNQFGDIDERIVPQGVDKDHFFIVYKEKESAEKAFKFCSELENRNQIKLAIDSIITENKYDVLLTTPKFYVRLVKAKSKALNDIQNKVNKSQALEETIKKEIQEREEAEFADWDVVV